MSFKKGFTPWNKGINNRPNCPDCGIKLKNYNSKKCRSCSHIGHVGLKGKDNGMWKEQVGYTGIHMWAYLTMGQPSKCEKCGRDNLSGKFINWANISGEYRRDINDWIRLCRKCHTSYDDIVNKSWETKRRIATL